MAAMIRSSTTSFSDENMGRNIKPRDIALGRHPRLDQSRASFAQHDDMGQICLKISHLALHLLGGLHHLGHIAQARQTFQHRDLLLFWG